MVFPLRDSVRSRRRPVLTYTFILINVVVFLIEVAQGPRIMAMLELFGMIPARLLNLEVLIGTLGWPIVTMVTGTFFHGSWGHLIGNMLYLWVFGDNIEDKLGRGRYLLFYLLCGAIASLSHALANPVSQLPTIGASGAVAGVLGGYILTYPRARVLTLVPIGLFVPAIRVPAWAYLGFWFVIQLFSGLAPIWARELTQTVAFWAHINGFLAGVALVRLLESPDPIEDETIRPRR